MRALLEAHRSCLSEFVLLLYVVIEHYGLRWVELFGVLRVLSGGHVLTLSDKLL